MRLATKILTVSLTFIVLLTAVAGYVSVRRVQDEFNQQQGDFAQRIAETLNQKIVAAYRQGGPAGVNQFLRDVSETRPEAIQIRLLVLDSTATNLLPASSPIDTLLRGSFGEPIKEVVYDETGRHNLLIYVPVGLTTKEKGALEFTIPLKSLDSQMRQRVWLTVAAIGTLALVSVLTAYFTGVLWVIRPLHKLSEKTERIGKGDFGDPLLLDTNDELSELAEALNRMCVELEQQKQTIAAESQQRLAMVEQLRHSDRLQTVGRLAAGVGHELGTPLNVISGRAGLIGSGRLAPEQVQESARIIKSETERITGIVRQLLDFARPRPPQRKQVDLMEILRHTVQLLEPLADKQGIAVNLPALTAEGGTAMAFADPGQLQQVFTNLIVNAIQALSGEGQPAAPQPVGEGGASPGTDNSETSRSTSTLRIDMDLQKCRLNGEAGSSPPEPAGGTHLAAPREFWCLTICDTGPGIPAELLPHIFEPFFTTKDVGVGTGLGLSIVHGIVQEHGGRIEVCNRESGGACFRVFLPRESP